MKQSSCVQPPLSEEDLLKRHITFYAYVTSVFLFPNKQARTTLQVLAGWREHEIVLQLSQELTVAFMIITQGVFVPVDIIAYIVDVGKDLEDDSLGTGRALHYQFSDGVRIAGTVQLFSEVRVSRIEDDRLQIAGAPTRQLLCLEVEREGEFDVSELHAVDAWHQVQPLLVGMVDVSVDLFVQLDGLLVPLETQASAEFKLRCQEGLCGVERAW